MCTVYFDRQDYREAMRRPWDTSRAHAICRKLLGVPASWKDRQRPGCSKLSLWYGAHYYAACALTDYSVLQAKDDAEYYEQLTERLRFWGKAFAREADGHTGGDNPPMSKGAQALWKLAMVRVSLVVDEAVKLSHSMLW